MGIGVTNVFVTNAAEADKGLPATRGKRQG
jgi:hypothetical protein